MSSFTPPPIGPQWQDWARQTGERLSRLWPKLQWRTARDTAAENGVLMWDEDNGYPVVAKNGVFEQIALGAGGGVSDGDKGDITVSGSGATWTIDNDAVTYAKMQNAASAGFIGATGSGDYSHRTPAEVTAALDAFTSSLKGLAPASGGGTTNFLRADGAWAAPTSSAKDFFSQSFASQGPGFATDTYLAGSSILIPAAGVKVGTRYLLKFRASKTAAGTAAPVISIRFGTAQSTADTARLTFTLRAQTAAADEGIFDVEVIFTAAGATATLGGIAYSLHRQTTTGFSNAVLGEQVATGTSFDATVANSYIGASVNGGASAAWTVTFQSAMLLGTN